MPIIHQPATIIMITMTLIMTTMTLGWPAIAVRPIAVVLELASFSLMFELKLGSGFDNMINLVALAKVISFRVRSKNCEQKCYYAV